MKLLLRHKVIWNEYKKDNETHFKSIWYTEWDYNVFSLGITLSNCLSNGKQPIYENKIEIMLLLVIHNK